MSLSVSSPSIRVELDQQSGRLLHVCNLTRDLDLIATTPRTPPFRLELVELGLVESFTAFTCEPLANGLRLIWAAPHAITVMSDVLVRGDDILFTILVSNAGQAVIDRIEYPIIGSIGRLGGPGQDELAHTHATGMLFHDPLDLFEPDPQNRRRLRFSPYPEGFAGSTMQFMAYYARNCGGFLIGTEDGEKGLKAYNFFKEGDHLCASIHHKAAVLAPGRSLAPPYAVVVGPLFAGTWYEAGTATAPGQARRPGHSQGHGVAGYAKRWGCAPSALTHATTARHG